MKTERRLETALKLVERLEKSFELEKTALIQPMDMEEFNMLPFEELIQRGAVRPMEVVQRSAQKQDTTVKADALPAENADTAAREEIVPVVTQGEPEDEEITVGDWETPSMPEPLFVRQDKAAQEHAADYFEAAATLSEAEETVQTEIAEEAAENDHSLPSMAYPAAMDYSRPAQKGLDNVESFLEDSKENEVYQALEPEEKPSLLQRLFRRRKDGKEKAE